MNVTMTYPKPGIVLALAALCHFSGCASAPTNQTATRTNTFLISPDVQVIVRHDSKRPFYIARRQRAYTATELQRYLTDFFAANSNLSTRAIALIPDSKTIGDHSSASDTIIDFATKRRIGVAFLSPQGDAIDDLLFGNALSDYGVPYHRAQ
jgi:hypothetical protein